MKTTNGRTYHIGFRSREALPSGDHSIAHPSCGSLGWASFSKRSSKLQGSPTSPSPRDRLAFGFFLMSLFFGGGIQNIQVRALFSRIYKPDSSVGDLNSIVLLSIRPTLVWRSFLSLPNFDGVLLSNLTPNSIHKPAKHFEKHRVTPSPHHRSVRLFLSDSIAKPISSHFCSVNLFLFQQHRVVSQRPTLTTH